ncbi:MAG TPA: ATP-binding protein [Caulobacteraceae bacterium]|jgi:PAS domain S-box-containing protein
MEGDDPQPDGVRSFRPFELDLSQEVCDRATRLAKTLFGPVEAQVLLVQNGRAWRSREPDGDYAVGSSLRLVLDTGQPLWVEDAAKDPRFCNEPEVAAPPYLKFYAAAPIKLANGDTAGALAVMSLEARPFNASLAGRLSDLAAFVADEWARAQATKAREQGRRERDALMATFRAVVRAMPVSLLITDQKLNVLGCSPRWAKEAGFSAMAAVGQPLSQVSPAAFKRWGEFYERVLAGETITVDRLRYRTEAGEVRWIAAEMAPWLDADGEVGGVIVSSHNVTHMVEALEAAERSEQRLTLAMEIADVHVYEMDYVRRELIKVGAEDSFFTEPKTYDQLFRDIYCTVDPRDRAMVIEAWQDHMDNGARFRPEYRVVRADDREVWASSASKLISDERGHPVRLIGAIQNVTAHKAAERALLQARDEAEQASQAKSSFLATMSHEIRTPLNGVLGMAQAMSADALSPAQRERLDVIRESGESLLAILNDLLDLSKIEAGKLELEDVEFDIGQLAYSAHAAFTAIAVKKGLSFDLTVSPGARGVYLGDCTRVRQILYNLVSNALKFTETGGVSLDIGDCPGGLEIKVRDTGIGIPAERLPHLFQKFEQADASTTRRFGGTGLGLAICRELALSFGGTIEVESVEGKGTTFLVRLPLQRIGEERQVPETLADPSADFEPGAELRVLAAEDNSVNQLVLRTLLRQAGIDPVIVSDGAEAVAAWRAREWDLILMDVRMPVMDGPAATRAIRELEAKLDRRRTPIVALTANAMAHQVEDYLQVGMDAFVPKPIEIARLFEVLQAVLDAGETAEAEAVAR